MNAENRGPFTRIKDHVWRRWMLGSQLSALDDWPRHHHTHPYDPVERLNWSINWHTLANRQAMRWYVGLKVVEVLAAAAIPVVTATGGSSLATKGWIAGLGALVVVLEGIQQLKKYLTNGLLWGQGKESLKREYYLYRAGAKPYNQDHAEQLLALRVEQIVSQEVSKWADLDQTEAGAGHGPADHGEDGAGRDGATDGDAG
jgi:Protein of unknown function (DUF4231)